jgi:DNA-binding MarR family transcriptional regulator
VETNDAVQLRRIVNRLARKFNASATEEGLTPTEASVLGLVAVAGLVSVRELIHLEMINPTMLSRVAANLERAGLVKRLQDASNARSVLVEVTAAGMRAHERIRGERAQAVLRSAAMLDDEERDLLQRSLPVLEKLARHLEVGHSAESRESN